MDAYPADWFPPCCSAISLHPTRTMTCVGGRPAPTNLPGRRSSPEAPHVAC